MPTPEEFGKLIAEKWELLAAAIVLLGGSGLVGGTIATVRKRQQNQRKRQIASGEFPFLVVQPYSVDVVKQLMQGLGSRADDPLADFNIRYQVRQQGKNVRQDLERSFERKPWVIILGRSGLGKTREAAHLAQGLSEEGWTVLKLTEQGWLDVPRQFPKEISPQDKLLFVIDDLNRWIRAGNRREIHRDAEDLAQPLRVSVQERILRVLEFFEQECRAEVRVIATARNEPEEREKLQFEKYPQFWQRFQQYELAQPEDGAIVSLLDDRTQEANISANPADFPVLASRSDGTFRIMVESLRMVQSRKQPLNLDTVGKSLERIWRKGYKDAVKRHPVAKYLYDAVELLRLLNVPLSAELVQKTAVLLVRGNGLKRLRQQWQIRQALPDLIQTKQILQPRDGQIEGKGRSVDAALYIPKVLPLLTSSKTLTASDFFAIGNALFNLGRHEEALASYDQALHHKPDKHAAWYNWGVALDNLGRYEEALASYDQALHHKPDDHADWDNRGNALNKMGKMEAAIASYDQALAIKPDFANALYNKACAYGLQSQIEAAITCLKEAISLDPKYREMAKTDADFDATRGDALFQSLLNDPPKP